jgi:hypothetical protein
LEAITLTSVGNVTGTLNSGRGTKKTEDRGLDVVRVVQTQEGVDALEDILVRVLPGNGTLGYTDRRASHNGTKERKSEKELLLHFR